MKKLQIFHKFITYQLQRKNPCKHLRERQRETERQRERQRETERDRERQRERQRETERDRETESFVTAVNGCVLVMPLRIQNSVKHVRWSFFKNS